MAYTYLNCVNKVLTRLREPTVGTVNASTYSSLIGEFVNDAKRVVEDAWNWQALRANCSFNLAVGVNDYNLSNAGVSTITGSNLRPNERSSILVDFNTGETMAWDITVASGPYRLCYQDLDRTDQMLIESPVQNNVPTDFSTYTYPDEFHIKVGANPASIRSWQVFYKRPQDDLATESDILRVPFLPVILLATNYALNERGEEIGMPGNEAEKKYMIALSDAISMESSSSGRQIVWTPE